MPLLFDLSLPGDAFDDMNKSLLLSEPDVNRTHYEHTVSRLEQLGIEFMAVTDWEGLFDNSEQYGEYIDNLILLKNNNEVRVASLDMLKRIKPRKIFLISIFSNVFEVKCVHYREMIEKEQARSFPFSLYTSLEDRLVLHSFARDSQAPGGILEIGTRYGGSLVPIILGNRGNPSPAKVFSVDCFYHEYLHSYLVQSGVDSEVLTYEMPSYRLARVWREASGPFGGPDIRLLWIDGDHSYIGIKTDLVCFLPFVSDGGTVALHDYDTSNPGIIKAVWEEIYNNPDFCDFHVHNGGIFSARKKIRMKSEGREAASPAKPLAKVPNDPTDALIWLSENIDLQNKKILFCGGGCHTREILTFASSFFGRFFDSITGIVDDNPQCACSSLDVRVHKFDQIEDLDFDKIIISSYDHENVLLGKLLSSGIEDQKIVCLYTNESFVRYVTTLPLLTRIFRHEFSPSVIDGFKG